MSRCDWGVPLVLHLEVGRLARQPITVVYHEMSPRGVPRPQEHGWKSPGMVAPEESARDEGENVVTTNLDIVE